MISGGRCAFRVRERMSFAIREDEKITSAMKLISCAFLAAVTFVSGAYAVEAGDAEQDVRVAWGNPVAERKKADGSEVWRFKDGTTVWLAEGVVQKIALPVTGNQVSRSRSTEGASAPATESSAATRTSPAKISAKAAPAGKEGAKEIQSADVMRTLRYLLVVGGLAVVASIMWATVELLRAGCDWIFEAASRIAEALGFRARRRREVRIK